jgi:hypothetical protein
MPTQRERFNQAAAGGTVNAGRPIPEFPRLPEFLRKQARSDQDKKDLEKWEADVGEFFKKWLNGGA